MSEFAGKVAIVTGASSGIGRATAVELANRGAAVVVADYSDEGGKETAKLITDAGGKAVFVHVDVSNEPEVKAMVDTAISNYGRLDYLVNNAGVAGDPFGSVLHEVTLSDFERLQDINVGGVFLGTKYAVPHMLKVGGGSIVNVSSVAGARGFAGDPSYCTSKHAVIGFTKSAALTYAKQGIRINAIGPGVVFTAMTKFITDDDAMTTGMLATTPMGRFATPEEMAKPIAFLLSDGASYITGAYYNIDGGWLAG